MTCRVLVNRPDTALILCGSGSDRCRCDCPRTCEHRWDGPDEAIRDAGGRMVGGSATCSRCGMAAMDHDLRVLP